MKKKIIIFVGLIINVSILILLIINIVILKNENKKIEKAKELRLNANYTSEKENIDNEKREKIMEYSYSIYFYNIKDVEFDYKGYKINLRNGLKNGDISPEHLIVQAEEDAKNNKNKKIIYKDGGSTKYIYEKFSILKMNSLNGNKDLYIGQANIGINEIE